MTTVNVQLYSILRHHQELDGDRSSSKTIDRIEFELFPNSTARDILDELGIIDEQEVLILINDQPAQIEKLITKGDTIKLIPLISGG